MNIEELRTYCKTLPCATEDIKWGNDLCFCVGDKMFCVTGLSGPFSLSFKVRDDEFEELSAMEGFMPAPYLARYKWVLCTDPAKASKRDLLARVKQSYELIRDNLPKKTLKKLGLA